MPRLWEYTSETIVELDPVIRNDNAGQVCFQVEPSSYDFTMPSFILKSTWRILQADGKAITAGHTVAPIDIRMFYKNYYVQVSFSALVNVEKFSAENERNKYRKSH